MNIALMTDDKKQELMTQFCIAYCGILAKHTLCATNTTGNIIKEATGLDISLFLSHEHGGCQQIGTRISYNEIDMVLFFTDPGNPAYEDDLHYICRLCDQNNVPIATNLGTAEMLIQGLARGDLDWRNILYPRNSQFLERLDGTGQSGYNRSCWNITASKAHEYPAYRRTENRVIG